MRPFVAMVLLLGSHVPHARAQGAPSDGSVEAARSHYDAGVSYYEQLRYEDAAREFREAYALSGRTHLLKNVATSLQHARRWSDAADAYDEYLERVPDAEDREGIEARVHRLRELAASEASGRETADEDVPDAAPLESEDGTVHGARGPERDGAPVVPIVLTATGAALGVGALVIGLMAHGVYGDLDAACPDSRCTDPRFEDDRDQGQTLAVTSTVLTGLALAVGVTGIVLWALHGSSDEARDPAVTAYLDGSGGGLLVRGEL